MSTHCSSEASCDSADVEFSGTAQKTSERLQSVSSEARKTGIDSALNRLTAH